MTGAARTAVALGPPNIAFVKYWGKRDLVRTLPLADSVSVCLTGLDARVEVRAADRRGDDVVTWNGEVVGPPHVVRYQRILARVRDASAVKTPVDVSIITQRPPRIGLAASSAAMSALAVAAAAFHGLEMTQDELSALARLGSGSACRSIPGGFARWYAGTRPDGTDSVARLLAPAEHWSDLAAVALVLSTQPKRVSSAEGMQRCVQTAPWTQEWVRRCGQSSDTAQAAIASRDFATLAEVSKRNALAMHALCMGARPPILYVTADTIRVLEAAERLSRDMPLFYTLDAGPNPILFTLREHVPALIAAMNAVLAEEPSSAGAEVLVSSPGPGARLVSVTG